MKKDNISIFKVAATYIGTVVGAGFATGQEIYQFFVSFGFNGLWGVILSTILFIIFGIVIMEMGLELKAKSHLDIVRQSGSPTFSIIMDIIISFCLFGALTAMMAGTGALFSQQLGLTSALGNFVMAVLTAMTVLTGIKGVINAISAVVPFLLVSIITISVYSIFNTPPDLTTNFSPDSNGLIGNWLIAAILYSSYNIIMSVSVLGPLGVSAGNKKTIFSGGILGALGLGIASVLIFFTILGNSSDAADLDVPLLYIAGNITPTMQIIYTIVLIAEIYTTAVGSLYGFSARITNGASSKNSKIVIAISVAAFFASLVGFSNLVKYFYPIEGYCGVVLLIVILFSYCKNMRSKIE